MSEKCAKPGHQAASFDHLIGASERSVGGTARPSALAVLKLMASSKWVGISIGRSPAPRALEEAGEIASERTGEGRDGAIDRARNHVR
jgi:hypothetical protein